MNFVLIPDLLNIVYEYLSYKDRAGLSMKFHDNGLIYDKISVDKTNIKDVYRMVNIVIDSIPVIINLPHLKTLTYNRGCNCKCNNINSCEYKCQCYEFSRFPNLTDLTIGNMTESDLIEVSVPNLTSLVVPLGYSYVINTEYLPKLKYIGRHFVIPSKHLKAWNRMMGK